MKIDFKFYAITDRKQIQPALFLTQIEEALTQGVRAIQVREKDLSPAALHRLCGEIKTLTEKFGAKLLVNDRCDIALSLNLDGVHLSEISIPADRARKILGKEKLIGVSAHSHEGVLNAQSLGADFVVLGPVAESSSKPVGHSVLPVGYFHECCNNSNIPVFALGGIHLDNTAFWLRQGAYGVAGISIWMNQHPWPDLKNILGHF